MAQIKYSFEFFPPKNDELEKKLWETVKTLESLAPNFVSVTYGAGGSTRERTHKIVKKLRDETLLEPASHLTCVGATRAEINQIALNYWQNGIKHIVALRGDMPNMQGEYVPTQNGYAYAADLVAGLKKLADFEISVAAYPEMHPAAKSPEADLENLKRKLDAGATRAITQFFFEVDDYFRFVEKAQKIGITAPIVAGVLPISQFSQAKKFAGMCGAKIPNWLMEKFGDQNENAQISVEVATTMCQKLIKGGVDELHFYTMNRADLTSAVIKNL